MFCQCTCMRMRTRSHLVRYHIRLLLVFAETTPQTRKWTCRHWIFGRTPAVDRAVLPWQKTWPAICKIWRVWTQLSTPTSTTCTRPWSWATRGSARRRFWFDTAMTRSLLHSSRQSALISKSRRFSGTPSTVTTLSGIYTARACVYEYIVAVLFTTKSIHPWILPWSSQLHYTVFSSFHVDLGIRWSGWLLASIYTPFIGDCLPQSLFMFSPAYLQALGWVYMSCTVSKPLFSFTYTVYIAKCRKCT